MVSNELRNLIDWMDYFHRKLETQQMSDLKRALHQAEIIFNFFADFLNKATDEYYMYDQRYTYYVEGPEPTLARLRRVYDEQHSTMGESLLELRKLHAEKCIII